jgi:hypothetical protein
MERRNGGIEKGVVGAEWDQGYLTEYMPLSPE